jgi:hypothetical protein
MGRITNIPTIIQTTSLRKNISLRTSKEELTITRHNMDLRSKSKGGWKIGREGKVEKISSGAIYSQH